MTAIENIVRACCVCHSIYRPHRDEWIDVGEPIYKEVLKQYNVSHGYCPPCENDAREELRQFKLMKKIKEKFQSVSPK